MIRSVPFSEGCPAGYHLCGVSKDAKGKTWLHCAPNGKTCPDDEDLRFAGIIPKREAIQTDTLRASDCFGGVCQPQIRATIPARPRLRR